MTIQFPRVFLCGIILLMLIGCGSGGGSSSQNLAGNTSPDQGVNAQILILWPELAQSCRIDLNQVGSEGAPDQLVLVENGTELSTRSVLNEASSSTSLTVNRSPGAGEETVTTPQKIPVAMFDAIMTFYTKTNLTGVIVSQTSSALQVNHSGQSQATPKLSFRFYYTFNPPGDRFWSQVDSNKWVERYSDGTTNEFNVQSHGNLDGIPGTFAQRVNAPGVTETLVVFFPDKGASSKSVRFRLGNASAWSLLAELTYY